MSDLRAQKAAADIDTIAREAVGQINSILATMRLKLRPNIVEAEYDVIRSALLRYKSEDEDALEWAVHPKQRAIFIRSFAKAILHGDEEHKAWLLEAAEAYIKGQPLPPPRAKLLPKCRNCSKTATCFRFIREQ